MNPENKLRKILGTVYLISILRPKLMFHHHCLIIIGAER